FLFPYTGWRPLFFLGGIPALLAIFIRARVRESEVWHRTKEETWTALGRTIGRHWKLFLYLLLLIAAMIGVSPSTQGLYPTFLERDWGFDPRQRALLTMLSAVGALCGGTLCGMFSDRLGRRRTVVLSLVGALLAIPAWAFAPSIGVLVAGAFLMQFFVQ